MPVSEEKTERILRVLACLLLRIGLPVKLSGVTKWWGLLDLIPFVTGPAGYRPVSSLSGIHTCPTKPADKAPHRG